MSKDERCIMDALRLCDLLMVLLCEGRSALPKSMGSTATSRNETGLLVAGFISCGVILYFLILKA